MPDSYVPHALLTNPMWTSAAAVEAVRLWGELPEGGSGSREMAEAAKRAGLSPEALPGAIDLLLEAGLVEETPRGYVRLGT